MEKKITLREKSRIIPARSKKFHPAICLQRVNAESGIRIDLQGTNLLLVIARN
jgi:hypothetical protein